MGRAGHSGELPFEPVGEPLVVIVEKRDPLTSRCAASEVSGFAPAYVFRKLYHPQPRVCDLIQGVNGFPIRTVNDHNALDVMDGLR
jgi:hypothetical protein